MSQQLRFVVSSSSGPDQYDVVLSLVQEGVRMTCTCVAGELRKLCKHRVALLNGDVTMLVSGQEHAGQIKQLISGTKAEKLVHEITQLEIVAAQTARAIAGAKRALARELD